MGLWNSPLNAFHREAIELEPTCAEALSRRLPHGGARSGDALTFGIAPASAAEGSHSGGHSATASQETQRGGGGPRRRHPPKPHARLF